jgi:hypothetical protein
MHGTSRSVAPRPTPRPTTKPNACTSIPTYSGWGLGAAALSPPYEHRVGRDRVASTRPGTATSIDQPVRVREVAGMVRSESSRWADSVGIARTDATYDGVVEPLVAEHLTDAIGWALTDWRT